MGRTYRPFKSSDEFQLVTMKIRTELFAVTMSYGLYRYLCEIRPKYRKAYYRTRFLWGLAQGALLSQTVLTLCCIYDVGDDRQNSLETLLKRKQNTNSTSNDSDKLREDIESVSDSDPTVRKLRDWRNHFLAHTNLGFVMRDRRLPSKMVPTHEELLPLIDRAMDILSRHCGSFIPRRLAELWIEHKEVDFVFDSVDEKIVAAEAEIRKWLTANGVNPKIFLDEERTFEEIRKKSIYELRTRGPFCVPISFIAWLGCGSDLEGRFIIPLVIPLFALTKR